MNEEKIKVVYFDGESFVYRDGNRLNEKEIVGLLVEYFEDCDALIKENEALKQYVQSSKEFTKEVEDFFQKCGIDTVNFRVLEELIDTDNFIYDEYLKLKEENEQLKKQLDYIQNSINEHIKHQKTELGQKALQEIIEDYNEWLLGHKRLQE